MLKALDGLTVEDESRARRRGHCSIVLDDAHSLRDACPQDHAVSNLLSGGELEQLS